MIKNKKPIKVMIMKPDKEKLIQKYTIRRNRGITLMVIGGIVTISSTWNNFSWICFAVGVPILILGGILMCRNDEKLEKIKEEEIHSQKRF